jgi:hypothetical protein
VGVAEVVSNDWTIRPSAPSSQNTRYLVASMLRMVAALRDIRLWRGSVVRWERAGGSGARAEPGYRRRASETEKRYRSALYGMG